jgi:hypothetical protein
MNNLSQDIKKINVSLEEGDKGLLLTFPPPPSGSVSIKDRYIYEFDTAFKIPLDPEASVIFTPNTNNNPEKESYLKSSIDSSATIGISIKSIHKAETQTLVRLQIKDIYNNTLYTDYILVVCSPKNNFNLRGRILPRSEADGIGPNGGRILRVDTTGESVNAAAQVLTRMVVVGPGIPTDLTVSVSAFRDDNRSDIELLPFFELQNNINDSIQGLYRFTQVVGCSSPEDLTEIRFNNRFLILDQTNNWSYSFRDKLIAQFIPDTGVSDYEDVAILLNIKNFDALIGENSFSNIPNLSSLYVAGRVIGDTICIASL